MSKMEHEKQNRVHPLVEDAASQLKQGKMDRREFVRTASLLGVSAVAAYGMAGAIIGEDFAPTARAEVTPKKGGTLRCSMVVQEAKDPATFDWTEKSNIVRHQQEYLAITGADNVTRPMLAESWSASDDLKTWTFNLRKDVKWHNGDDFTSKDVAFNFNRWLDPATGSSNMGLFSAMTEEYDTGEKNDDGTPKMGKRGRPDAVEIVDDHTIRVHLNSPVLSIPENLYNYPTAILHHAFKGDVSTERNGTGAFQIAELVIGNRAILKRAPGPYWGGEVYLDEIHYYDQGVGQPQVTAVMSKQADMNYEVTIENLELAKQIPNATVLSADTAQTGVMRMHVTEKPFDDHRLRRALQLCCDVDVYPKLVYQGGGRVAEHHHVSPIHPEYFPLPKLERNIAEAKKLLAEAGYADGVDLSIDVGNTNGPWQQQVCEIMREQCAPAGIKLAINVMPASKYWELWTLTPFGITAWTHRPLGTMALSLAYRTGVPWNETNYASKEFDDALDHAESLIDVDARRVAMEKVENILQDAAVIVQPLWQSTYLVALNTVKGLTAHPTQYHQFNKVWMDV